jgi:hypothetical protein
MEFLRTTAASAAARLREVVLSIEDSACGPPEVRGSAAWKALFPTKQCEGIDTLEKVALGS